MHTYMIDTKSQAKALTCVISITVAFGMIACGGSSSQSSEVPSSMSSDTVGTVDTVDTVEIVNQQVPVADPLVKMPAQDALLVIDDSVVASDELIKLNQLGFMVSQAKTAVIPDTGATSFSVIDADDGTEVYSGSLTDTAIWDVSGQSVRRADFTALETSGRYRIKVEGLVDSPVFAVDNDVYQELLSESIRAYYRQRAGSSIEAEYDSEYVRPQGHADTAVLVHSSAVSVERPENTVISSPKGWYDAGDYGKYVVNSGITGYTLMLAFEQFPEAFLSLDLDIPESGDHTPDLLDELRWNLDWMLSMQDLDGGVYHKLTSLNFSPLDTSPADHAENRYVIGKSVTASLNLAATLAFASRVYEPYDSAQAKVYLTAAENAWSWALANPTKTFTANPEGVRTGSYDDTDPSDEFAWAAVELFIATDKTIYEEAFSQRIDSLNRYETPGWQGADALALMSATAFARDTMDEALYMKSRQFLLESARAIKSNTDRNPYEVPIYSGLFYWGSNSNALYNSMVLMQAAIESESSAYLDAAGAGLDYVLGRNATDYSFVTGFGSNTPKNIHHRPSISDSVEEPYPGLLVGGANNLNFEPGCDYPSDRAALAYVDAACSYSTNEVAINWNAPLVYMSAAVASMVDRNQ